MAKRKMIPTPADNIARQIMETYQPQDAQEIQDIVKRIFAPIFEAALKGEIQNHLGYADHEHTESEGNTRNDYSEKTLKTTLGEVPIHVPRDRQGTFEPQIVKKYQRDVSSIEGKVLALYGRGMSQRDIAATVEDIYGFKMSHEQISHITDCMAGLEDGARAIFPQVVVQRCIVHLVRSSIRYIPRKDWSRFTKDLKAIYGAVNARQARERFEQFQKDWASYPGAVAVWQNNFTHVEQLFSYGSAVRKVMYTTNAIESVNASFRKVTKKGSFPNEDDVFKLLYLRVQQLYQKWSGRKMPNWALVRNQLLMDERMAKLMEHYDTTC